MGAVHADPIEAVETPFARARTHAAKSLIVSHQRSELELWTRGPDGWTRRLVTQGTLRLKGGTVVDVDRLYAGLPP